MALLLSTVVFILSIKASSGYSCHPIPTELSLCHNFTTIKTLRLPNGLGHSMIGQVIQQAVEFDSAFSQINCHKDTTLYACSLLTPFCYERNPSLKIEPCRSFCERIAGACLENLLMFGIETPDYLKCENFNNDGLCFDPEKSNQVEELTTLMGAPIEGSSPVTSPPSGSLDVATLDRRNMFTEQEFVANLHALQTKADKIKIIVRAKMRNAIQTKKRFATARIKSSPIRKFLDRRNLIDSNFTVPVVNLSLCDIDFRLNRPDRDQPQPAANDVVFFFLSNMAAKSKRTAIRVVFGVLDQGLDQVQNIVESLFSS